MADLSAVLRKTIDGLPNASPELRAKVYDKARAAIERQIAAANPPLADELIEARRSALADAIDRTEDHYLDQEAAGAPPAPQAPSAARVQVPPPVAPTAELPRPSATAAALPHVDSGPRPSAGVQKPAWPTAQGSGSDLAMRADARRDPVPGERTAPPVVPAASRGLDAPRTEVRNTGRPAERREPGVGGLYPPSAYDKTEPSSGLDTSAIPAADVAGPRYGNGRRPSQKPRSRSPLLAGVALVVVLGGAGALAYVYKDRLEALLTKPNTATATATAIPSAGTSASTPATVDGSDVATLAPATPAATTPPAAQPSATPKRRFTQRLLPDGTEVDEGPGAGSAADFGEGTNIAAASPDVAAPAPVPTTTPEATTPEEGAPEDGAPVDAEATVPPADVPVAPAAEAEAPSATPAPQTDTAALTPDTGVAVPAVAQKAVFYEERTETEQGSQRGGNVVWSVVEEAPSDGAPPEPAIRAVADVPEENLRLTMTIRRNTDATLPASHVIEMMFDVPPNFAGGQIANVQRLALKPTEEARGEPLIGVAGKISDGFFIVALNNLAQATQTNLGLLGKEQWIDIPLAYSTGRRALISIEKGIPGDRVFKQAMDAWAAKT